MATAAVNGTELYYTEVGHGMPCLVMHGGLGFDHTYLHPWLDPLGDRLRLIYYDHRNNGRSGEAPPESMTHAQLASDADELAEALGLEQVAVLGHSYGGFIALEMALRFPARVSHLILMDTAPHAAYGDEIVANAIRKGATEPMLASFNEPFEDEADMAEKMQALWPLYFKFYRQEMAEALTENVILRLSGFTRDGEQAAYNVIPQLSDIRMPSLILVGVDDFVCPPSQAKLLHEGIPDSELVIFEDSGHFPYVEEPQRFFPTVLDWLERNPQQMGP